MARRDTIVAYLLLLLGGPLGLHKFYLNQVGWGIAYFFTGGFFFIGVLVDLFTLPSQIARCNWETGYGWLPRATIDPGALDDQRRQRQAALLEAECRLLDFDRRLNNLETVIHAKRS